MPLNLLPPHTSISFTLLRGNKRTVLFSHLVTDQYIKDMLASCYLTQHVNKKRIEICHYHYSGVDWTNILIIVSFLFIYQLNNVSTLIK